jgi:pyruvate dehydrogenase (quinone)
VTSEEAKHMAEALVKGDPDEGSIIKRTAQQVLASVLPAGKGKDER